MRARRIGIDTGGTFTDFVLLDADRGRSGRRRSRRRPDDPSRAIRSGLAQLAGADAAEQVVVGTTVATNAVIQRAGPTVALRHERGLRGRACSSAASTRSGSTTSTGRSRSRSSCAATAWRSRAASTTTARSSSELEPADLERLRERLQAARRRRRRRRRLLSLLVSEPGAGGRDRRRRFARSLPDVPISVSHEVSPVWREYERASTTVADAFVKPLIEGYVDRVGEVVRARTRARALEPARVERRLPPRGAGPQRRPARLLLSGLAGGVIGARFFAEAAGSPSVFSLDMGGTSCDIGLVLDGRGAVRERVPGRLGHPGQHPLRRREHDRRRRRLDRLDRQGRVAPCRPAERRGRAGPRRLRAGRHGADAHRREPDARPARPRVLPRRGDAARRATPPAPRSPGSAASSASRPRPPRWRRCGRPTRTWRTRSG